jgi:DNA-binding beta-propeller fold protein YncE
LRRAVALALAVTACARAAVPVESALIAHRTPEAVELSVRSPSAGLVTVELGPEKGRKARRQLPVREGTNRITLPLRRDLASVPLAWEATLVARSYSRPERIGTLGRGEEQFTHPLSVALGTGGRLYVADTGNDRIEVLSDRHTFLFEFGGLALDVGRLPSSEAQRFDEPYDLVQTINKDVYVVDRNNARVVRIDRDGRFLGSFGREAGLKLPRGIASNSRGEVIVADAGNDRIVVFDRDGRRQRDLGAFGRGPRQFKTPFDVAVDDRNGLIVADTFNDRIQLFDNFGKLEGILTGAFEHPLAVRSDPDGALWVVDGRRKQVVRLSRDGRELARLAAPAFPFEEPTDVAVTPDGHLYVVDRAASALWRLSADTTRDTASGLLP